MLFVVLRRVSSCQSKTDLPKEETINGRHVNKTMVQYLLSLNSKNGEPGSVPGNFTIKYAKPLSFSSNNWEVGLISAYVPKTYYNISAAYQNNKLHYSTDNGSNYTTLTIPDGNYSINNLNAFIQASISNSITIAGDSARMKVYITLAASHKIDFTQTDTFRDLLGFGSVVVSTGTTYAASKPNITNSNDFFYITTDIISSSYSRIGGQAANVLYPFTFSVNAGSAESIVPAEHVHLKLGVTNVDSINIRIVNQDGQVVDFNGENVIVNIKIKETTPLSEAMF